MDTENLSSSQRKELAKLRRMRARIACDLLLARLYIHHGRDHGGVEYRLVEIVEKTEQVPTPEQIDKCDALISLLPPQKEPDTEIDAARPTMPLILREVARYYMVGTEDIISSRRSARVILPRQMAMYLSRTMTLNSLPEIGRRFGNRDHTTVRHGVLKIERLIECGSQIATEAEELKTEIKKRTLHLASIYAQRGIAECNSAQTAAA